MSYNTFGQVFRVTTFGESHGQAMGCVVDGMPPRIHFKLADVQEALDRRRPGQSRFTTQRREPDQVRVLSGVMEEAGAMLVTTGTPIALVVDNVDQRSRDYSEIADKYRPGHADYTYEAALKPASTRFVLSPDSPFFRYFGDLTPKSPPPSPAPASAAPGTPAGAGGAVR
jgi:chorismate synthase